MDITDKTVVLTGATGGIGRAIARQLDAAGARLILVGRNAERLAALQRELEPDRHRIVRADLSTAEGRDAVLESAFATGIDLLINNAGTNEFELFRSQSAASIRDLVEINLLSPILICRALLPILESRPVAGIVNIGSTFGSIGYPGFSAYSASKFGLRGFTEALRRELDDSSVRVSYVAPRATKTELNSDAVVAMNAELGTAMDDPDLVATQVLRTIRGTTRSDRYIGWPEKLFVRINALLPGLVDNSLRKQLPVIRRFATHKQ
ncbi:MAG: SDR family oxidoreductase [Woeseiaceae bacterium]